MELSSLLQQIRHELNLTQAEMVEQLSLFDSSFDHLDLITYSRWERGVSVPSTLRIVHLLGFAQYDVLQYLIDLELKLSETKNDKFRKLEELHIDQDNLVETAYYPVKHPHFIRYNAKKPLADKKQLEKINGATARFFHLPDANLVTRIERVSRLQKENQLHILTCEDEDQYLCAHALYSIHNLSEKIHLIEDVKSFYQFPRNDVIDPQKFLFSHSFMRFTYDWWVFNCYVLIDILCKNPDIEEVYCVVINRHSAKLYQHIGFSVREKIESNKRLTASGQSKLMSITREDFLSHHGTINWLKEHKQLIQELQQK